MGYYFTMFCMSIVVCASSQNVWVCLPNFLILCREMRKQHQNEIDAITKQSKTDSRKEVGISKHASVLSETIVIFLVDLRCISLRSWGSSSRSCNPRKRSWQTWDDAALSWRANVNKWRRMLCLIRAPVGEAFPLRQGDLAQSSLLLTTKNICIRESV